MSRRKNVPDLRLLAPVLAGTVGARLGLSLPGAAPYVLAGAAALVGIGCLCVPSRRPGAVVLLPVGAALLVGAVLTAAAALRADAVRRGPSATLAATGARVRVDAEVTGDPKTVKSLILLPVRIEELQALSHAYRLRDKATVLAHVSSPTSAAAWAGLLPSMHIRLTGRLVQPKDTGSGDAATLLVNQPPQVIGGPDLLQRIAGALRADLRRAVAGLPPEPAGVLPALTLGDTSAVPSQTTLDLKTAGLSFLTVVSGENLVFISAALLPLAKRMGLRARALAVFGALVALGFTALARPGPPMVRATVTALLASTALATGRRFRGLTATAGAALILLLIDPWLANAYGFILSVAATAGLLITAPRWRDRLIIRRVPVMIATAAAFTAAAELYCEPLLVTFTGRLPLLSVPANVLAVPAAPAATVLGTAAMAGQALWPPAGHAAAWLAQWPTRWICLVGHVTARIPGATVPWPRGVLGCLALLAAYGCGAKVCRSMQPKGPFGDLNG
ncbi:ComEC/Rec2 family competence protein [Actinospica durhamensis]|uniref:ComEC/Rec2 family competence protein n=1 Tax=Actinospica durhamensis TaxID=1508375 RepID=A0A941IQ74_9ACTN|nr:ComEC/Rec2 family competence protein [Actinospica durhamensis]MBR7833907.1 ComEC/Rec2 family competence protein [Actinospica durhamensis]